MPGAVPAPIDYRSAYKYVMVVEAVRRSDQIQQNHEDLYQARKVETIANLAGGVAHDFNNLLSAILANLDLLRAKPNAERRLELIEQAQQATERGASLTRQLLAVGRRSRLQLEPLAIAPFLDELQRLLPSYIQIRFCHDKRLDGIEADRTMLQSVVINLALNARNAMSAGGQLEVTPPAFAQSGQQARRL